MHRISLFLIVATLLGVGFAKDAQAAPQDDIQPGESPAEAEISREWRDPDLLKAIEYDDELNSTGLGNQQLAEKHYLQYLEREEDPFRRAWAYTHLGLLFGTNINLSRGEKPDYPKSQEYFTHAIKLQPDLVNGTMLRARLGMAVPMKDRQKLFEVAIEGYEWMKKCRGADMRSKWRPVFYPRKAKSVHEAEWKVFHSLYEEVWEVEGWNLVHTALLTKNRLHNVRRIKKEFPNTPAGKAADKWLTKVTEETLDDVHAETISKLDKIPPATEVEFATEAPSNINLPVVAPKELKIVKEEPAEKQQSDKSWIILVILGGVAILAGCIFYLVRRSKNSKM